MTSTLYQININYNPGEDRILLRASTTGRNEYRVWLTRRFVDLFLDLLNKCLAKEVAGATQDAQDALLDWQKQEALKKTDFSQKFEEPEDIQYPFGQSGILAHKMSFKKQNENFIVTIAPETGQGIDLSLTLELMQSIDKMLEDAIKQAQWNLSRTQPRELPSQNTIIH